MTDNLLQCGNILSLAAVDLCLALACGLLVTDAWLTGKDATPDAQAAARIPGLIWPASLLLALLATRFYLITSTMTGHAEVAAVWAAASGVAATHAGAATVWALGAACGLSGASFLPRSRARVRLQTALLLTLLVLHSGMGHAAGGGDFTRDEMWQFVHLAAMSLWAGAVMTAGFFAAPRMLAAASCIDIHYLRNLSQVSLWSLAAVALSGAMRAWAGLDARIANLLQGGWGRILLAKLCIVCVVLLLGFMHRRAIHAHGKAWTLPQYMQFGRTLRIEAVCFVVVLFLSAWLASTELPGS